MPIFQKRLLQLGQWLKINGEAIYDTLPWQHQQDSLNPNVWYTCTKMQHMKNTTETITAIYAIVLKYPKNSVLMIQDVIKNRVNDVKVQLINQGINDTKGSVSVITTSKCITFIGYLVRD